MLVLAVPYFAPSNYMLELVNLSLISVIVVIGLNFVTGYAGQINFGQAAFYGIGAYVAALLTRAGISFWLALPAAGCAAGAFGVVLGIPTLRLRAFYLAMATIGFGEIVRLVLIHWESVTGGSSGLRGIPGVSLGSFELTRHAHYYYLLLAFLSLLTAFARRLRDSRLGRAMMATRDSEIAAEMMGVDTVRMKILAFVLSAVYAGIAGALYAGYVNYVSPEQFSNQQAILYFTMLLVGGIGTIAGAVIGTLTLTFLPEFLRFLQSWYMVVYGVAVILIIVLMPRGIVGLVQDRWPQLLAALGVRSRFESAPLSPLGRG